MARFWRSHSHHVDNSLLGLPFHGGNRGSNPRGDASLFRRGCYILLYCAPSLAQKWRTHGGNLPHHPRIEIDMPAHADRDMF